MWDTLKTRLDTSATRSGRTTLLRQFSYARPKGTDEPISEYIRRLLHYRQQLEVTNAEISDEEFRTHLYTTVPSQFEMTIEMLMCRTPEPSVEEIIAAIQQKATTTAIAKDISDPNGSFNTAMYSNTSSNRGSHRGGFRGGFRGRGRGGRYNRQPYRRYCNHCRMTNHNTKDCHKAPDSTSTSGFHTNSNESRKCYYCTQQGHLEKDCPTKKAALELRKGNEKAISSSDTTVATASIATADADDVAPYSFD